MQWKFYIKEEDTVYAELYYDAEHDIYSCIIFNEIKDYLNVCPLVLFEAYKQGVFMMGDKECRALISDRLPEVTRENMKDIMKRYGIKKYHECELLAHCPTCLHDTAVIELAQRCSTE